MTFITLATKTINVGGVPVPTAILLLAVVFIGVAVVGGIVAGIVSKARRNKHPQPDVFEQMVASQMESKGMSVEQPKQESHVIELDKSQPEEAQEAEASADEFESEEEPTVRAKDAHALDEDELVNEEPILSPSSLVEEEEVEEVEEEAPLVKKDEEPIADTEEEDEDIPDLIAAPVDSVQSTPAVVDTTPDTTEEEDEIVLAAVDTAEESDKDETLLSSMTDYDKDYGDFDFGGDFDEWEEEPDEPDDADEVDILGELDVDDDDYSVEQSDVVVSVGGVIIGSKYRRSFRSKLIQGSSQNKQYYAIVKNELLSYEKTRCKESWSGETFMWGRRTYARMGIAGKTLCVFLALDPKAYADVYSKLRFRDVSSVRKYANTPMMMRVKSDLSLRRTLRLITHVALSNDLHKNVNFTAVDYKSGLATKSDEELLTINLIKLNPKYVQQVDTASALQEKEEGPTRPILDVTPVKKEQVGNLTEKDLEKLTEVKTPRTEGANRQFASETGKFVIEAEGNTWHFWYYSPNGKLLCVGEGCNTRELAYRAVTAYREALGSTDVVVNTVDDKFFYTVRAHGRVFSSVMYDTQAACLEGLRMARETAAQAVVEFAV